MRVQRGTFLDRGFARSFLLLEELTEELRQSEKAAYEKLIRMMSHEVNNSVGASSSLLQSSLSYSTQLSGDDRADFERALQIAIDRMGQLNVFMRSFADVVRLPPPGRQAVNLVEVLRRIEGLVRADREARGIGWRWAIEEDPAVVTIDPVQIEQALLNIVKNAIEAIDHGAPLPAGVRRDGDVRGYRDRSAEACRRRWRLEIEDTGPGVTPGGARAAVHAVLHDQTTRAGDWADHGAGDPVEPRLRVQPRLHAPGTHHLHHRPLTTVPGKIRPIR